MVWFLMTWFFFPLGWFKNLILKLKSTTSVLDDSLAVKFMMNLNKQELE